VLTIDLGDHQPPWLICGPGPDLHPHDVLPDRLDCVEVNAVFLQVGSAFSRVIAIAILGLTMDACLRGLLLLVDPSRRR
jgi:hypothetical protein